MGSRRRAAAAEMQRFSLEVLERQVRKLGSMEPDEHLLDAFQSKLIRFFENGEESREAPRSRLPLANRLLAATYTRRQMLFVGGKFARNCPLLAVYRAEVQDEQLTVLFSPKPTRQLSMIQMQAADPLEATAFARTLIERRDAAAAEQAELVAIEDHLRRIREYPFDHILDLVIRPPG